MLLTIEEAREALRLDGADNDQSITALLEAVPEYINSQTGIRVNDMDAIPLVKTAARFLLILWYNAEQADSDKLQRTINSLMATLSLHYLGQETTPDTSAVAQAVEDYFKSGNIDLSGGGA